MASGREVSRREVSKSLGAAAGIAIAGTGIAGAAVPTPAQTEGPFYPVDEQADKDLDLTRVAGHTESATGDVILVRGRVLDSAGQPLEGALVDVWQANHYGRYTHPDDKSSTPLDPHFQGWGLVRTDVGGRYGFKTIMPAAYRVGATEDAGIRCRHIHFKISGPGSKDLTTQMYFRGDPLIEKDLVMADTPEELRHLLIADSTTDAESGLPIYRFDIVLTPSDA